MVCRAFNICHNSSTFEKEISRLKQYLASNGYPVHLFETTVKHFLNNKFAQKVTSTRANKEIKYVTLPLQGYQSNSTRNKLQSLFQKHYPSFSFTFSFTNANTVGSLFRVKD